MGNDNSTAIEPVLSSMGIGGIKELELSDELPGVGIHWLDDGELDGVGNVHICPTIHTIVLMAKGSPDQSHASLPTIKNLPSHVKTFVVHTSCRGAAMTGSHFLAECEHLTAIEFGEGVFSLVSMVTGSFMRNCSGVTSLVFPPGAFQHLTQINQNFLRGCDTLESVTFPPQCFASLKAIHGDFISGCPALVDMTFPKDGCAFSKLKFCDGGFLSECFRLKSISFPDGAFSQFGREDVDEAGSVEPSFGGSSSRICKFMENCKSLETAFFPPGAFANLDLDSTEFLCGTTSKLKKVIFSRGCFADVRGTLSRHRDHRGQVHLRFLSGRNGSKKEARADILFPPDLRTKVLSSGNNFIESLEILGATVGICWEPWSWGIHHMLSPSVRTGALSVHCGISYGDSKGEVQLLPAEVAHEICAYINSDW